MKDKTIILELLNAFRDCFATGIEELGCTNVSTMDIKEVNNSMSITCKPYKTTSADRETIAEIVGEWKRHGSRED